VILRNFSNAAASLHWMIIPRPWSTAPVSACIPITLKAIAIIRHNLWNFSGGPSTVINTPTRDTGGALLLAASCSVTRSCWV
jgi:hypothetical protein